MVCHVTVLKDSVFQIPTSCSLFFPLQDAGQPNSGQRALEEVLRQACSDLHWSSGPTPLPFLTVSLHNTSQLTNTEHTLPRKDWDYRPVPLHLAGFSVAKRELFRSVRC